VLEVIDSTAASAGERVFFAQLPEYAVVLCSATGRARGRALAAATSDRLFLGESGDAGLIELARARREAEQALRAGQRTGRRYTSFAEIGAAGLLGLLATPQAVAFAESLLRPLVEHDVTGRGDLVRSLGAWLEHNGQWDTAAAALGVHRHTLRHRMRRVSELLGRDLDVTAVRMELWAGVQVLQAQRSATA
jgi:purine catabolism regulator